MSSEVSRAVPVRAVIVGGPTASGKSALAVELAEALGGTVINADSMQVYRELDIVSARPGTDELARAPHRLYGFLSASEVCSAALWRERALEEIAMAAGEGRVPVLCGGTGLYLHALTHGLSEMPDISPQTREEARALHARIGGAALRKMLAEGDPVLAARLHHGDSQRLIRAWEVLQDTGQPLSAWQQRPAQPPEGMEFFTMTIQPDRAALYRRCDLRFEKMLEEGALEEVRDLMALDLDPSLPAMKALGVPQIIDFIKGNTSREECVRLAQRDTRRYAKRQITWFRNQVHANLVVEKQDSERSREEIFNNIRQFLLTGHS
ncbi:tRNA (adenosine(37)-N6)-dimethylallyltransferase MiaA [Nisaea acidiphila]|uniref:tRNA dimethylallyltransferase n=1 Tax=Nisaea acidiphila TaxID=1862145 RepID=A0A9J7APD7_9PROT|nr:tRNA (adenosine(37)-N6)-dimethylallyltransferase MiaA [Nisaea acidiphila]UUX49483.1 tRNA (adenosine(37)-N6)-dimethylallyltransferase MiaA [Nisaea acidiphila]